MKLSSKSLSEPLVDIRTAANFVLNGGVVGVPTETVYGLAANALNPIAVRKIFDVKGRPYLDPLIVHVGDISDVEKYAHINKSFIILAKEFSPGPITYVLKKKDCIDDIVTGGRDTVAIRIPKHPMMQELLSIAKVPLSAPSANPFGYISPTSAYHVIAQLGGKIDGVIDGGECECGVESTIIMLSEEDTPRLLRQGPISIEEIEGVLRRKVELVKDKNPAHILAPGMMKSHYSPKSNFYVGDDVDKNFDGAKIFFMRPDRVSKDDFWLSEKGDLVEAAKNLFKLMRYLDGRYKNIFCQFVPKEGIGNAINDRLSRAKNV